MDLLAKGGIFMFPILMVSIAALALILERVYTLWLRYRLDEEGFLKGLMHALDEQDFSGALEECARAEKNGKKTKTHVGNPALRDWPIGWK